MSRPTEHSRQELASFLRRRRESVSPRDIGLPAETRRRTPGLRREEVAVFAGVSPTWYAYLEQGRDVQPSPEVLDRLAQVLRLTDDEQRYLHLLVHGRTVPVPPAHLDDGDRSAVARLVDAAGTVGTPLYAVDHAGGLVACNDTAAEWYADWRERAGIDRNVIWWMCTDPQARVRLVDWADEVRDVIWRLRAMTARHLADEYLRDVVDRLRTASTWVEECWTAHEVRGQRTRVRRLRHPVLGPRAFEISVVHPDDQPSVTVAFHLPARARGRP